MVAAAVVVAGVEVAAAEVPGVEAFAAGLVEAPVVAAVAARDLVAMMARASCMQQAPAVVMTCAAV